MLCADGYYRKCFPMLCAILADYEEQVLIAGVKMNEQCSRCTIPPKERSDLTAKYPWRTPEQMNAQRAA